MKYIIGMIAVFVIGSGIFYMSNPDSPALRSVLPALTSLDPSLLTASNTPLFNYLFNSTGTLNESGAMISSTSPYWWVNSGGRLIIGNGTGKTMQGDAPDGDKWRVIYARANAVDTDNGLHPQNIFRLVTKGTWHNFTQQAYFKINGDQLSTSPNRNQSNGILLFNRYVDSQNLYYTGIRVDGTAVIKKKQRELYTTLAQSPIVPGTYNHDTNPNLLPKNVWIGLRSVVTTSEGKVTIMVYTDVGRTGTWKLVASATDDGVSNGPIIDEKASAGIRTDFMDVEFEDYSIKEQ